MSEEKKPAPAPAAVPAAKRAVPPPLGQPVPPRSGVKPGLPAIAPLKPIVQKVSPAIQLPEDFDLSTFKPNAVRPHGQKVMFIGESGAGKTVSAAAPCKYGLVTAVLALEDVEATLLKHYAKYVGRTLFIMRVPVFQAEMSTLATQAHLTNVLSYKELCASDDVQRSQANEYVHILQSLMNFTCSLTGAKLGSVDTWGKDRHLVVDSLTAVSIAAKRLVAGTQTAIDKNIWGTGMQIVEQLITKLTALQCFFTLTAHPAMEMSETEGRVLRVMPNTLGAKLAPTLPRPFDEVVRCEYFQQNFVWGTTGNQWTLKGRDLPLGERFEPSWVPILKAHGLPVAVID